MECIFPYKETSFKINLLPYSEGQIKMVARAQMNCSIFSMLTEEFSTSGQHYIRDSSQRIPAVSYTRAQSMRPYSLPHIHTRVLQARGGAPFPPMRGARAAQSSTCVGTPTSRDGAIRADGRTACARASAQAEPSWPFVSAGRLGPSEPRTASAGPRRARAPCGLRTGAAPDPNHSRSDTASAREAAKGRRAHGERPCSPPNFSSPPRQRSPTSAPASLGRWSAPAT